MKPPNASLLLLGIALSAASCADKSVTPVPGRTLQKGWRPAEIPMTEQELKDGGVGEVVTMGPWVLVMAGYGNLYLGKEGDSVWRRVAVPDSEPVSAMFSDGARLFCGVVNTGRIYTFNPESKAWSDLGFPRQDSVRVTVIRAWNHRYVAFFLDRRKDSANGIVSFSLTPGDRNSIAQRWNGQITVLTVIDLDSTLVVGTADSGIYRYTVSDPVWRKLPSAFKTFETSGSAPLEYRFPRVFAMLDGTLWQGQYAAGLFSIRDKDLFDSAPTRYARLDSLKNAIPVDVYSLLAWRGRLFISGTDPSQPMVLDPATNHLQPLQGNFCRDAHGEWLCDYLTTYELAATTDTLYAASGGRLFKIGYNEIPQ